jgi:hypothetical protein
MNALLLCLSLSFNLQFAIGNSQFAMLAAADPVQAGRDALDRGWSYPWYDAETDGVKRIEAAAPREGTWQPGFSAGGLLQWPAWIAIAGMLMLLSYALLRAYFRREKGEGRAAAATGAASARQQIEALPFPAAGGRPDFLAEARRLYEAGDYTRAIVFLFSHQLRQLDRRQLIRLARGKTNRQYLGELASRRSLRELLERTMFCFEEVFFGRRTLDRARFESCWLKMEEFEALVEG